MKKLSIIILSYNVKGLLLECLASIPKHADWEIIVVDNASSDASVESVRINFPQVKIIENTQNLGFAAGNNIGIRKSTGEYVLLLNPDTKVMPKTIETILSYVQAHPEVGAATCKVELPNGQLDYSCHRSFPNPWNSLQHFMGLKSDYSKYPEESTHEIDALTGAFALIRRTAGEQVGWLDEDYHWNGEDLDFCYKLKEKGWKIMYIPEVKIMHYKGASSQASKATRLRWAKNSTDAMRMFYQKHLAQKYPKILNLAVYVGIWLLKQIRSVKANL